MAPEQEDSVEVTDSEIFNEALNGPTQEQTENAPEKPEEAPTEAKSTRARDDSGRFVKAAQEQPEQPTEPEPQPEVEEKQPHHVPLMELLNEREKRQNEQRLREQYEWQLKQLQQQMQKPQQPQPEVDIFADPAAWQTQFMARLEQQRKEDRGNWSLQFAAVKHGQQHMNEAWQAMLGKVQQGDDSVRQSVLNSPDPGETLANWYRTEKTLQVVGTDPEAFLAKALDEALENPEFLAAALEKAKAKAATRPTQVKIPPSLNKATGAGNHSGDEIDINDSRALFNYAMGR